MTVSEVRSTERHPDASDAEAQRRRHTPKLSITPACVSTHGGHGMVPADGMAPSRPHCSCAGRASISRTAFPPTGPALPALPALPTDGATDGTNRQTLPSMPAGDTVRNAAQNTARSYCPALLYYCRIAVLPSCSLVLETSTPAGKSPGTSLPRCHSPRNPSLPDPLLPLLDLRVCLTAFDACTRCTRRYPRTRVLHITPPYRARRNSLVPTPRS